MHRKIILTIFLIVIAVSAVGYFVFVKNSTPYASQAECEQKTGKQCYLFKGLCQVGEAQNQKEAEENEKFLRECLPKIGTWQPIETTSQQQNSDNQNPAFLLDFSAGGSIFGSSFEVKISGVTLTYRETTHGGSKEVQKIERALLPAELTNIQKTIADAKLTSLQSQDFTKEPIVTDQASYRITVSLNGKENTIRCGTPPSGTQPTSNCQKQIDKLRLKLNNILDVNIY